MGKNLLLSHTKGALESSSYTRGAREDRIPRVLEGASEGKLYLREFT